MAKESNIKEELLKQMDRNPDTNIKSPRQIIARDMARVKRLKWITVFSWLLVVACFVTKAFLERAHRSLLPGEYAWLENLTVILQPLFLIAIIFTVSLYIRSRTLTIHKIQARLANIEMLLKKMSQDK